jgi:hypothetical protein
VTFINIEFSQGPKMGSSKLKDAGVDLPPRPPEESDEEPGSEPAPDEEKDERIHPNDERVHPNDEHIERGLSIPGTPIMTPIITPIITPPPPTALPPGRVIGRSAEEPAEESGAAPAGPLTSEEFHDQPGPPAERSPDPSANPSSSTVIHTKMPTNRRQLIFWAGYFIITLAPKRAHLLIL